jgi:hypothetical protein
MYEMEGASQFRGSNSPIARPANPWNTPPSVGKPGRTPVDSVPASRKGAFPGRLAS